MKHASYTNLSYKDDQTSTGDWKLDQRPKIDNKGFGLYKQSIMHWTYNCYWIESNEICRSMLKMEAGLIWIRSARMEETSMNQILSIK